MLAFPETTLNPEPWTLNLNPWPRFLGNNRSTFDLDDKYAYISPPRPCFCRNRCSILCGIWQVCIHLISKTLLSQKWLLYPFGVDNSFAYISPQDNAYLGTTLCHLGVKDRFAYIWPPRPYFHGKDYFTLWGRWQVCMHLNPQDLIFMKTTALPYWVDDMFVYIPALQTLLSSGI